MNYWRWVLLVCLVLAPAAQAQDQRPSLGPSDQPSLHGPSPGTTSDQRRLVTVRAVYIERIDNKLSDKIADALSRSAMLKVADKPEDADAILRGTCFRSRRLKRLHSEVFLTDRASGASIWQDVVMVPWDPPALNVAVDQSANKIVTQLFQSMQRSEK